MMSLTTIGTARTSLLKRASSTIITARVLQLTSKNNGHSWKEASLARFRSSIVPQNKHSSYASISTVLFTCVSAQASLNVHVFVKDLMFIEACLSLEQSHTSRLLHTFSATLKHARAAAAIEGYRTAGRLQCTTPILGPIPQCHSMA